MTTAEETEAPEVPVLLSVPEAALLMKVHPQTAMAMLGSEDSPIPTVIVGRRIKVRKDDLLAYLRGEPA